jgi:hypothetical protein
MPNTYLLISSNVLSSNAASITFSSIPNTYTDLVLRVSARSSNPQTYDYYELRFNSDSANNYTSTELYSNSSTVGSVRQTAGPQAYPEFFNGDTSVSNAFGSTEFYIPNYLVSANKPFTSFSVSENNASTANSAFIDAWAGLWSNTAAITSIFLKPQAARNFLIGSSFYLYGIKNS